MSSWDALAFVCLICALWIVAVTVFATIGRAHPTNTDEET